MAAKRRSNVDCSVAPYHSKECYPVLAKRPKPWTYRTKSGRVKRIMDSSSRSARQRAGQSNPRRAVLIYGRVLEIQAQKSPGSQYPGQKFYHPFTSKAKVYGLPNGDLLITTRRLGS